MAYENNQRRSEAYVKIVKDDETKYYTYDWLDGEIGQNYLKKVKEKEWKVYCVCNGEPGIQMHLAEFKNKLAIKNNKNENANCELHITSCPRYKKREIGGPRKPARKKNTVQLTTMEDGTDIIQFNSRDFQDRIVGENNGQHRGHRNIIKNEYTSIFKIGELLISTAWKNYIMKFGYLPKEGNLFHIIFNDLAENCYIRDNVKLSKVMFIPRHSKEEKDKQIDITEMLKAACYSVYQNGKNTGVNGNLMYVLAKLKTPGQYRDLANNIIEIELIDPYRKDTFRVTVDKSLYNRTFKKKIKVTNADYYVSCYTKRIFNQDDQTSSVHVVKMAVIPVMKGRGIYVQSSKEIEFAEMLIGKRKLFLKPSQSNLKDDTWGPYIPDFLLLDRKTKNVTTIVEVFGFYTEEYRKKMKLKIKYFNNQKNYKFLYWKANEDAPMPKIY